MALTLRAVCCAAAAMMLVLNCATTLVHGESSTCCAEQQVREALAVVAELKAAGAATAEVVGRHGPRAAWLLAFYRRCLAAAGRVDLDDLVPLAAALLHDHPAVKAAVSGCARHSRYITACVLLPAAPQLRHRTGMGMSAVVTAARFVSAASMQRFLPGNRNHPHT